MMPVDCYWTQDIATNDELERLKQNVSDLTEQLNSSRSDYSVLLKRIEDQQTEIALERSHMEKQLADQRKRLTIRARLESEEFFELNVRPSARGHRYKLCKKNSVPLG